MKERTSLSESIGGIGRKLDKLNLCSRDKRPILWYKIYHIELAEYILDSCNCSRKKIYVVRTT